MRVLFETLYDRFYDGWCIAARAYARAMERGGAEVFLHSWLPLVSPRHPRVDAEVGHMMRPCTEKWDVYVWSGTFGGPGEGQLLALQKILSFRERFGTPVVFYTMFERTNVQPELVSLVNRLDGVMVPCSSNLLALERAGVTNARFMRVPYFREDDRALCLECVSPPRSPPQTFYWIGRWEPRKAPHNLVRAFLTAFDPKDDKRLVLKVGPVPWSRTEYAPPEQVIEAECGRAARWTLSQAREAVQVVRDLLSPEQIVTLHQDGDVYVSASHGEGIDMPAFSAKIAGRRVVTTACGGPLDFVSNADVVVPSTGELEMPEYASIWGPGSTAFDYNLPALVDALRHAAFDFQSSQASSESLRVKHQHNPNKIGNEITSWFRELVSR